jgi:RNA polymerase sigma-70 factor (ECF subfamily)
MGGTMQPLDSELLERWRGGDRGAGELLMTRHYRSVLRFFELNASWAAQDLTQRTFVACIERADALRDAEAFRAYLLGVARRQLALHQRELSRTKALRRFNTPEGNSAQLSTLLARGREQVLALRALATLPRRAQTLLILYYWDGVPTTELATNYRVPTSTIRTRLARARDLMRRRLFELDVAPAAVPTDDQLRELLSSLVAGTGSVHVPTVGHP